MVIIIYYIPYIIYDMYHVSCVTSYMISGIDCIMYHTVFLLWSL